MPIVPRAFAIVLAIAATVLLSSANARGQVTTATLYGVVHDSTGAILPGVMSWSLTKGPIW